jgi:hypothetical protein
MHSNGDITGMPPLNHDHTLKQAKIHFTGLGDMFVFYNKLLKVIEQFSVFITPLNLVTYLRSLLVCPHQFVG